MAPGYHLWTAPDGQITVHLRLDVVDRLLPEIMSAFGAVPKRGAEAGGVLLGTVEPGTPTVVRVEDFEPVPCSHKRGPSFLLSDLDYPRFEAAATGVSSKDPRLRAVGYYRSHTRDAQAIGDEDRAICTRFFPSPSGIALIIRPAATRTGTAGFLTYHNRRMPDWPASEFPFRGVELARIADPTVPLPERRPLGVPAPGARRERGQPGPRSMPRLGTESAAAAAAAPAPAPPVTFTPTLLHQRSSTRPRLALLAPLALVLLFAGVLLGYIAARTFLAPARPAEPNPYAIGLSTSPQLDSLLVRWDRDSVPAQRAERGILIVDRGQDPPRRVNLSAAEIRTGSVLLMDARTPVTLRLELYLDGRRMVGETIEPGQ